MMEGTKKTWTLDPPKDQAGIYKGLTIVQMPGDVMYLPPGWSHSVSLSLSRLPLCLSMSLMYWQVTTDGGLTKVKKANGKECEAAALTIVA